LESGQNARAKIARPSDAGFQRGLCGTGNRRQLGIGQVCGRGAAIQFSASGNLTGDLDFAKRQGRKQSAARPVPGDKIFVGVWQMAGCACALKGEVVLWPRGE
jgi:hypothetical protein